jgi:Sulfotransferase family
MNTLTSQPRPLLMIPIRRCGSHALRLRLNFSPDFYSPYPLHLVDFMPLLELYGDLTDDYNYFQLVIDLVGLQNATMVKWENVALDPLAIFAAIQTRPRSVHSIVWEMLFQAGRGHQAKVVMDKSLDNVHYYPELVELFDDMLFLNVVRDPRAQISSINRSIIHDFDTLLNTLTWLRAHETAKALVEKYPKRCLTVRFEDFIADQQAVLIKICNFIGIAFTPNMLDTSVSEEAKHISTISALWESNAYPPIPSNLDKFKKYLSVAEIALIESLTGNLMDHYGYERITTKTIEVTDEMLAQAKITSDAQKQLAWQTLRQQNPRDYQLRQFRLEYLEMLQRRLSQ